MQRCVLRQRCVTYYIQLCLLNADKSMLMAINQPATQSQIYSMDCTSYYNENNLCVCYMDGNQHLVICFLKDKVSNTAGDGIAIGSNVLILHNQDQV